MAERALLPREIDYPSGDGKPMSESDPHFDEMTEYVVHLLQDFFARQPRVHVAGNSFVFYEEGDRKKKVSPDCYVVKDVRKGPRNSFMVWKEGGRAPCFVVEVTSEKTHVKDAGKKLRTYRDVLKVPEYFLVDPRREWVEDGLRGFRLESGEYREIEPDRRGRLASRELGLELAIRGGHLRFFRPEEMEPVPTRKEAEKRALAEKERERAEKERERTRAERAERELERLRAKLRKRGRRGDGARG